MTLDSPSWDALYDVASTQEGHFTTVQAAAAGYSRQLLAKHLASGRIVRVRRSIYRLVHFPVGEHEELVVIWLWTNGKGVFSHETALALHGVSDALPARIQVTLPAAWRGRRLRVPRAISLYYADVRKQDRSWVGSVPVTSVSRTLTDCAAANVDPHLIRQAVRDARGRGLLPAGFHLPRPPESRAAH